MRLLFANIGLSGGPLMLASLTVHAMALTHLARTGSQSLRIKVRLYLSKLKLQFSPAMDIKIKRRIDLGRCSDEFLTLNTPWSLNTDSFLQLISGLGLQDDLLSCLMDIPHQELLRLLNLVLSSTELSTDLVIGLFLWTTDVIKTGLQETAAGPELLNLWLDRIQEQGRCRQLFGASFRRILNRLLVRMTRSPLVFLGPWSARQKISDVSSSKPAIQGREGALNTIQGFLRAAVMSLAQGEDCIEFAQDVQGDLKRWDALVAEDNSGLSHLLPKIASKKRRRVEDENRSSRLGERLITRQRSDSAAFNHARMDNSLQRTYTHSSHTVDDRYKAFITICNNIRHYLDHSTFSLASSTSYTASSKNNLSQHIQWVESTISARSSGWRSCVKLKLQFYAVFSEISINEDFADLICRCGLQWELCDVLCRYLKRYRADSLKMPLETLQLGCELLLSVFTKSENLRTMMRDRLFVLSRSVPGNARDPLFGSWDLWRLNIDTLLISTLNQIVATDDQLSSSVSPRTVESLIKISLIAPFQVVSRTIQSAITNRGQCTVLLQTLASLGQLVWLRSDSTQPTLLATVLRHLICEKACENQQQQHQRQENLTVFVLQAMDQTSPYGMVLLDQTEFLQECVLPLLKSMISRDIAGGCFLHAVATILIRLYEPPSAISAVNSSKHLHAVHFQVLRLALQLRSLLKTWASDQTSGHGFGQKEQSRDSGKIGGEHIEDVSRICELSVMRLASFVKSGSDIDPTGRAQLEDFVRSQLEHGDANNWESKLAITPLISACRQRWGDGIEMPRLPYEIRLLCNDHLKVFSYSKTDMLVQEETNVARALLLSLSAGRMCDEAIQDIAQALSQTSSCRSLHLETMLAPAIYRVLSISSRSECHRLLIQGVPSLVSLCPGSSDVELFYGKNTKATPRPLGPYWSRYAQGGGQAAESSSQGATNESTMDLEDGVLSVLRMLETLLRFALEPVPPKQKNSVLQVYELGVGSDIMVDQMASLVQSSIKTLRVDWSLAHLDLVLYSFFMICKMSFSVSGSTGNKSNAHQSALLAQDTYAEESRTRQRAIAKSKARDELVLMAMNILEEIIKRVDACQPTHGKTTPAAGSESGVELGSDRGYQELAHDLRSRSCSRGQENITRTGAAGHREDKAGNDYPSPTSPSVSTLLTIDGLDERTPPLPNSPLATATGVSATESNHAVGPQVASEEDASAVISGAALSLEEIEEGSRIVVGQDTSTVNVSSSLTVLKAAAQEEQVPSITCASSSSVTNNTSAPSSAKPVLAPHQVDCLMLGMELLPAQERQAVKARLRHVLPS
ncbi:hypothetical protein BGZ72_007718 [Mortierella alpina]|nr:hypothetical protein BGZ72_007718 [Mortierella alpina]